MSANIYRFIRSSSQPSPSTEPRIHCPKTRTIATTALTIGASLGLGMGFGALIARVSNDSSCNLSSNHLQRDCRVANITIPVPPEPLSTNLLDPNGISDEILEKSVSRLTSPIASLTIPKGYQRIEIIIDDENCYTKSENYSIDWLSGKGIEGIKPLSYERKIDLAKKILTNGFTVRLIKKDNEIIKKTVPPGQVVDSIKIKDQGFDFTTKDLVEEKELEGLINTKLNSCEAEMCTLTSKEDSEQFKEQLNSWCKLFEYRHK